MEELARKLDDKEIVFTVQIDEPCDQRILTRELRRISDRLERVEAIVVLACGTAVQVMASAVEKPCLAGLDTLFAGTVVHVNKYLENCLACGECILNETAGICPKTRCPKGILNGPCSEKLDEKCSVDPDTECVWVAIENRRQALGMERNAAVFLPQDWARRASPRCVPEK
ncbi:MAG: 5,10-methylenetetrahydrofolate reductase [Candidatus Abyssobacteria bacterium SURF_17]|uniref:5,10-methylenetetrahydrofolate reductase n=1 Tax=Candidatus Abyssobacteria bacterium SURF_17 TaxID=2093361 RepID=A0A419EZI4_9BACT|nr:MAG: 5,10-methylenetetrahydrofolate reductase [Candidatus Abyssubacteria bacterium SURF_17]